MTAVHPDCSRFAELLSSFYDGELDPQRTLEVEQHIEDCSACEAKLESFGQVSSLLGVSLSSKSFDEQRFVLGRGDFDLLRTRTLEAAGLANEAASGLTWVQKLGIAAAGFLLYFGLAQLFAQRQDISQDGPDLAVHTHRIIGSGDPDMEHVVRSLESSLPLLGLGVESGSIPGGELTPFERAPEALVTRYVAMQETR